MGTGTGRGVVAVLWILAVLGACGMMVGSLTPWIMQVVVGGFALSVVCSAALALWVLRH